MESETITLSLPASVVKCLADAAVAVVNVEKRHRLPRDDFMVLKRVFIFYVDGKYTEENVLNFFAGFCQYVPTEDDVKISKEVK